MSESVPRRAIVVCGLFRCLTVGLLTEAPAAAQGVGGGAGAIEGVVSDESGAPTPGVTVTATSPALQVPQLTTVSSSTGAYRLPTLPAGVYVLKFELPGFQTVVRNDLRLNAGFVATINIQMKVGNLEEAVTVSGASPVVDVRTTSVQTNVTTEMLDAAPVTRTMWQVLAMTPGVRVGAVDVGGSTVGNQQSYTTYGLSGVGTPIIEGLDTSQNDSGGTALFFDYATFDEVQVKSLGNNAEVASAGTTFIATVKSGGNSFHGRYFAAGQSGKIQSKNLDDRLRANGVQQGDRQLHYYDVSADIGGRIIRNKLWFYGAIAAVGRDQTRTGYSETPGADSIWGNSDDIAGTNPISTQNATAKVSYQLSRNNRLVAFYAYMRKGELQRDGGRFRGLESTSYYDFPPATWKGEWQGTPTNNLLVDVLGGYLSYWANYPAQPGSQRPGNPSRFDLTTQRWEGPNNLTYNRFKDHWQSSGNVVYFAGQKFGGSHELKMGYNLDWEHYGQIRPDRPSGNYLLTFDNNVPFQISTYDLPHQAQKAARQDYVGLYGQDRWSIGQRLTINAGARWEQYHQYVNPVTKSQGQFGTAGSYPKVDVLTLKNIAPRIGVAFDLTGDAKTVFKANFGRFNKNLGVDVVENWNASSLTTTVYRWRDLDGNRDYTPGEVNLSLTGPDFISTSGAATTRLNRDLEQPVIYEATAAVERQVASNFSLKAVYVHNRSTKAESLVNPLRQYSAYNVAVPRVDPGPDGVIGSADDGPIVTLYDYNPAFRGATFVSRQFVNAPPGRSDSFHTIEVAANKRQSQRFSFMGSFSATKNHRWLTKIAQTPNDELYPLDETWTWFGKLSVTYRAPRDIQLATFYQAFSGAQNQRTYVFRSMPQSGTVTVRLEPFGAQTLPNLHAFSFRASKDFPVGRYRLNVAADVYNLFNINTETNVTFVSGPTYRAISGITQPRIARFGATISF